MPVHQNRQNKTKQRNWGVCVCERGVCVGVCECTECVPSTSENRTEVYVWLMNHEHPALLG